ncbi:Protein of unknown function [Escherichia coli]|nr:Protein of unknown function [Escherichia coli]CDU37463.1 Protein of unknown function [Escherichia coli]
MVYRCGSCLKRWMLSELSPQPEKV